jgi:hypothetical protein
MGENIFDKLKREISLFEHIACTTNIIMKEQEPGKWIAHCPQCEKPGFMVYKHQDIWKYKCSSCRFGTGTIIDFEMGIKGSNRRDVVRLLCEQYDIPLDDSWKQRKVDVETAKEEIQEYFISNLLSDPNTLNTLIEEYGFKKSVIEKYGIGIAKGNVYEHFKERYAGCFEGLNEDITFLHRCGIAGEKQGRLFNGIPENTITVPIYTYNDKVSHWYLHKVNANSHQIKQDLWADQTFLYNQKHIIDNAENVAITSSPVDAILLEERGIKAVAPFGKLLVSQIEYLKKLSERHNFSLIIGGSPTSRNMKLRLISELQNYHNLTVYEFDKPIDLPEYFKKGMDIEKLKKLDLSEDIVSVEIRDDNSYWALDEEGIYVKLSNFILHRKYMNINETGEVKFLVTIEGEDGIETTPREFDSSNFSRVSSFVEWLGFQGDYYFDGTPKQLSDILKYLHKKEKPYRIGIKDCYGKTDGVFLANNGAMKKGRIYKSNGDGVVMIKSDTLDGFKSIYGVDQGSTFNLPEKIYDVEKILECMLIFWPQDWVYVSIGLGVSIYYFDVIRPNYSGFPLGMFYGITDAGKTSLANCIGSFFGCGHEMSNPSGDSTKKGVGRYLASMKCLPVIWNETEEERIDNLVHGVYDGDMAIIGQKSVDNRTRGRRPETTLLLTTEKVPKKTSIVNRTIPFNFWDYEYFKDKKTLEYFVKFERYGINGGRNFGLIKSLDSTDGEKRIIDDIDAAFSTIYQVSSTRENRVSSRAISNLAIVMGSFKNAARELEFDKILDKLNEKYVKKFEEDKDDPINIRMIAATTKVSDESIASYFVSRIEDIYTLTTDQNDIKHFFELLSIAYSQDTKNRDGYMKIVSDKKSKKLMLRFNMTRAWQSVKAIDNRSTQLFKKTSVHEVKQQIRKKFKVNGATKNLNKSSKSCFDIRLDKIENECHVHFKESWEDEE